MTGRHKTGEVCVAVEVDQNLTVFPRVTWAHSDVESDLSMKDAEGKELARLCKIPIACSK